MATEGLSTGRTVEVLDRECCLAMLGSRSFARLCSSGPDGVVVVDLTTYALQGPDLYFRASAFGQVARVRGRPVTLQVDDAQDDRPPTWSVTVRGPASRVEDAAILAMLWSAPRSRPWEAGLSAQWLALGLGAVQGRLVRRGS